MAWKIEFEAAAEKELSKIDRQAQKRIRKYLVERVAAIGPRSFGAPLRADLAGLWKYRVGNYRLIAEIQDEKIVVLVLLIGHRKKVYGGH
ncbi:type II toxin-antitoxin system RelE/ParE family toxin [Desulfovibrio sp. JC010]|uniref:type II toxin-antitoxin system RelE family toxin n=1 Tax=Desulfovibrio sp. JC010 TaxID=2593641 RepID=UPI0013CFB50A|nr:type II toxin-antitoxin system RelE/ParE family toxin [Desulfovibrio sp. JC010]NDV25506.1 type II toxin-antitoxin system RelE/ParE family toxin [Desulfovibrio sp. JC010]